MAESLPSPPVSRISSRSPERQSTNALSEKLDLLLEEYLELLDQYTILRDELSQHLSSGFFTLAQAQKASNLGASRRYGQDFYDERTKAIRRVKVAQLQKSGPLIHQVVHHDATDTESKEPNRATTSQSIDQIVINNMSSTKGSQDDSPANMKQDLDSSRIPQVLQQKQRDPLKWFGILIPPALRQCQGHFTLAVTESIPEVLDVNVKMLTLETKIRQTRNEISQMSESKH